MNRGRIARYTKYTSNKSFSEWGEVLWNTVMTPEVLNKILNHRIVINIRSE